MTTFDLPAARTAADDLLDRLRSGSPLTPAHRAGLAELLDAVRRCRTATDHPGNASLAARSGLLRTITERFDTEFGDGLFNDHQPDCSEIRCPRCGHVHPWHGADCVGRTTS